MTSSLHKLVLKQQKHDSAAITSSLHKLVLKQQKHDSAAITSSLHKLVLKQQKLKSTTMTSSLHKLVLNSWNNKKHESTTITSSLHKLVLKQQKRSDRTVGIDIICHSVRRRIILTWKFQDRFQVNKHMFNHDECCINLLVWHFTSLVKRIWYQFVGNTSAVITLPSLTFSFQIYTANAVPPTFVIIKTLRGWTA